MESSDLDQLKKDRRAIRPLLSPTDPADALTSYYALWHDPQRTRLTIHRESLGRVDGFVAVCMTGADLFRPLVTLRAPDETVAGELLHAALTPGRPYQVIVPVRLAPFVREHIAISSSRLAQIYQLHPTRFEPVINVLVQKVLSPEGVPRFQIESQGSVVALSGTNWRSPSFAEVFVYVHASGRGRGWGKSVVSACTAELLESRLRPLYMVEEDNEASVGIAEGLGYGSINQSEFAAEGQLK